jgi:hypothetical protein
MIDIDSKHAQLNEMNRWGNAHKHLGSEVAKRNYDEAVAHLSLVLEKFGAMQRVREDVMLSLIAPKIIAAGQARTVSRQAKSLSLKIFVGGAHTRIAHELERAEDVTTIRQENPEYFSVQTEIMRRHIFGMPTDKALCAHALSELQILQVLTDFGLAVPGSTHGERAHKLRSLVTRMSEQEQEDLHTVYCGTDREAVRVFCMQLINTHEPHLRPPPIPVVRR